MAAEPSSLPDDPSSLPDDPNELLYFGAQGKYVFNPYCRRVDMVLGDELDRLAFWADTMELENMARCGHLNWPCTVNGRFSGSSSRRLSVIERDGQFLLVDDRSLNDEGLPPTHEVDISDVVAYYKERFVG